jgi:hypothetical protein
VFNFLYFLQILGVGNRSLLASGNASEEGNALISVVAFHFLAGSVAGSIFAVRTLLTLVAFVLMECVGATIAWGLSTGLWLLGSLFAVQVGYLAGSVFAVCWNMWVSPNPTFAPAIVTSAFSVSIESKRGSRFLI